MSAKSVKKSVTATVPTPAPVAAAPVEAVAKKAPSKKKAETIVTVAPVVPEAAPAPVKKSASKKKTEAAPAPAPVVVAESAPAKKSASKKKTEATPAPAPIVEAAPVKKSSKKRAAAESTPAPVEAAASTASSQRHLSGYMVFAKENRASIVAKNTALSFQEVGKEIGKQWKALTDAQREQWNAKGLLHPIAPKERSAKKAKGAKADESPKKRTLSGYMVFANEQRGEIEKVNPTFKFVDISKAIGARWNKLTEAQKEVYNQKGKLIVIEIKPKKSAFKPKEARKRISELKKLVKAASGDSLVNLNNEIAELTSSIDEHKKKKTESNSKRGKNAYMFYLEENRNQIKAQLEATMGTKATVIDVTKKVSEIWHTMTENQKAPYVQKATVSKSA